MTLDDYRAESETVLADGIETSTRLQKSKTEHKLIFKIFDTETKLQTSTILEKMQDDVRRHDKACANRINDQIFQSLDFVDRESGKCLENGQQTLDKHLTELNRMIEVRIWGLCSIFRFLADLFGVKF